MGGTADTVVDELHAKKDLPLHVFIGSLNIKLCSRSTVQAIVEAGFDTIDSMRAATLADIASIPKIELHVHFGGSVTEETATGLARRQGLERPLVPQSAEDEALDAGRLHGTEQRQGTGHVVVEIVQRRRHRLAAGGGTRDLLRAARRTGRRPRLCVAGSGARRRRGGGDERGRGGAPRHRAPGPHRLLGHRGVVRAADRVERLVEADGSRMLPAKAPAAHEPAMPASTTLVVALAGSLIG